MDDNYFLHENYKNLLPKKSKTAIPEDVFLFVVYYAFSQIHSQDFTQRSAAVICLRDFIRHSKKCDPELFRATVDNHIADIISRGLASTNDRVQLEFIELLTECVDPANGGSLGNQCPDVAKLNDQVRTVF